KEIVQFLDLSLNLGQVRKVLRPYVGLSPSFLPSPRRTRKDRPVVPLQELWRRRPKPRPGSPCWRYLTEQRALPAFVVNTAIIADALREGPYGSAWFAHRDHTGLLRGIEMRGPNYRGFSAGGNKTLFRLQGISGLDRPVVARLVVAEAPIDAMSVAAIEHLRADTLYVATAGGMGPETIVALELRLRDVATVSDAVVAAATDADKAGAGYAARLVEMAQAAGVRFERLLPPEGLNDWNDVLQKQGTASMKPIAPGCCSAPAMLHWPGPHPAR
ncbi:MAG: DUF3991 and toprim domain-containing protein, partial [Pseudomonadota bacterium]|nr:DUF3991 and toprim domain-containing protein [Pseudomonadota bacterium]